MNTYRFTCDVWGKGSRGLEKFHVIREGLTAEEFTATSDEHALKKAKGFIGNAYRWSPWQRDATGWECHRTAWRWSASWMRVERIT